MQKLVTHFSLRLGLELSGEENCIGFHPILLGCKRRNPQNLAGSVPKTPTLANILTHKKEQKSLLLESVIPAVEEAVLVYLKHSKRYTIFTVCAHTSLTDKYIYFLTRKVRGIIH